MKKIIEKEVTVPRSFRLKIESQNLLNELSVSANLDKTQIVEYCVARYAIELGVDVENAKQLLLNQIGRGISASCAANPANSAQKGLPAWAQNLPAQKAMVHRPKHSKHLENK